MSLYRMVASVVAVMALMAAAMSWSVIGAAPPAQQAGTPVPVPPGERLPGQYAFYPSEVAQLGGDLPGDPAIQLVKVTDQVFEPINIAAPNDGSGRVFVVERGGVIRIIDKDGTVLPDPFLDISGDTEFQFLEEGLLGLAFHPDFANNGLFYINYTNQLRNGDVLTVQYKVSADDPNKADPASSLVVSERNQPFPNHIGGDLVFGPDGYLYIGHGDGGLEGDPLDTGQDLRTHLGKLLRIDVAPAVAAATGGQVTQAAVGGKAYTIPPDNPFTQGDIIINLFDATEDDFARFHPYAEPMIWDYGLRNPWQFSFDRKTGDLYIADVGQNFWEEINFEPAGSGGGFNYGWKFLQGSHCFPISMDPDCPKVGTLPVAEYEHGDEGCTVVGGHVYRGEEYASLDGIYFSSDFCSGTVRGLARDEGGTWQFENLLQTSLLMTGSGEDEAGNIYFTSCECGYGQNAPNRAGAVWKVVAADQVPDGAETAPLDSETGAATPEAESAATPSEPAEAASPATGQFVITAGKPTELSFDPNALTIPANTDIQVTIQNQGAAPHNFSIDALGISVSVQPGDQAVVLINAEPGDYEYYCNVPGHKEGGMVGTLTVQ